MTRTTFSVPKMDCGAEEQLVRMTLASRPNIRRIDADLHTRQVMVFHEGNSEEISALLAPLNLGAQIVETTTSELDLPERSRKDEAHTLKIVLAINAGMFVAEMIGAYLADYSALLADSLDMFADATVYGIALFGVNRARTTLA
jgi:cation transport ATPase